MHTFQPFSIEDVEFNPFTKIGKEWALVSAGSKAKSNCMTVSWGGLGVMWRKNCVFIFIRDSRYTKQFLDAGDLFSVSFFDESYRDVLNYCGSHTGEGINKFEEAGLTAAYRHSIPYPDEANFVLLCKKLAAIPMDESTFTEKGLKEKFYSGDEEGNIHTMYVGEIIESMAR